MDKQGVQAFGKIFTSYLRFTVGFLELCVRKRMAHAAMAFLIANDWFERKVRFDVVEISRCGVLHIPNAFSV